MMIIELLNELEFSGTLTRLYKCGLIDSKIKFWREVYLMVDAEMKSGNTKSVAVTEVSGKLKISERVVWKILRRIDDMKCCA